MFRCAAFDSSRIGTTLLDSVTDPYVSKFLKLHIPLGPSCFSSQNMPSLFQVLKPTCCLHLLWACEVSCALDGIVKDPESCR